MLNFKALRTSWPYIILFIFVIMPLFLAAFILAIRSKVFDIHGATPSSDEIKAFLTFIGGGLATAATIVATLLTWRHNQRAERQLELDTITKGLEALPEGMPRVAGAMATMVLLGHQAVAMRVLEPAWGSNAVDSATATWLIGQVLSADQKDETSINEAASILLMNASKLTLREKPPYISTPGSCFTYWHKDLPARPRRELLAAMAETLLSQEKSWWVVGNESLYWPTGILAEAAVEDSDAIVRNCAAVLLDAVLDCFPEFEFREEIRQRLGPNIRELAKNKSNEAKNIPAIFLRLGQRIRTWGSAEPG